MCGGFLCFFGAGCDLLGKGSGPTFRKIRGEVAIMNYVRALGCADATRPPCAPLLGCRRGGCMGCKQTNTAQSYPRDEPLPC